jgi:hypothetical protein
MKCVSEHATYLWQPSRLWQDFSKVARRDLTAGKVNIMDYTLAGDYYLPNLKLSDPPPLGRYGRLRKSYLKEWRTINYNRLLLREELYPHLRETDTAAQNRRKLGCSEEVILSELVYN